ncbi:PREDICTED: uncharacterized protein LOC109470451 [Branchiostoma belcheri]|uniref:Uncharacterized protein LOC109470451 n=1 Tax=Branchiostoma belcheri TaxID=7741 RepID=A0A6P4Z5U0_BRABE|nr:PREDICTED: uncharacterized protein LOC109470451 [Branchiostoma belcheri]
MTTYVRVRVLFRTEWNLLRVLFSRSTLKALHPKNLLQITSSLQVRKVGKNAADYCRRVGWLRLALTIGSASLIAAAPTREWWRVTGDDVDKLIGRAEQSFGEDELGRCCRTMALRKALQVVEPMEGDKKVEALSKIYTRLADLMTSLYEAEWIYREGVHLMEEGGPTRKSRYLVEGMRTRQAVAWLSCLSPRTPPTHHAARLLRNTAGALETSAQESMARGAPNREILIQLATTMQKLGQQYHLPEAELSLHKALMIYQHMYGLTHPDTIRVFNDLGNLYKGKEDYDRAISCYNRAIELGKAHAPWLVSSILRNLGTTLADMDDKSGARATFQMALKAAQDWQSLLVRENSDWKPNLTEEGDCRDLLEWIEEMD